MHKEIEKVYETSQMHFPNDNRSVMPEITNLAAFPSFFFPYDTKVTTLRACLV
ncbi:hypothetical protein MtrunA17_Chr6g0458681 [Medicago truncatula]|uniref:Uncharacterized protein n=1 Tax=Medicago truncatula TaxID=3880 RepID=A0A396HDC8_MEDTR|nr:hypothetical protein MtrunA17_Chr6g0458681 [Medicago truncatula]